MTHAPSARTRARRFGGVLAGVLALGAVPLAGPAWALDPPPARSIGDPPEVSACPIFPASGDDPATTQVPEDGFSDVAANNTHEFAIDCVAWYQVTAGKTASTYVPEGSVQRDQMATFIAQMIDYVADRTASTTDGLQPAGSSNPFPCDLGSSNVHFDNIKRLAAAGVVQGSGSSSAGACYEPDETVTRAQMATFLREANEVAGLAIPDAGSAEDYYVDDATNPHQGSINAITKAALAEGVGTGPAGGNLYDPNRDVRRDQMGTFIARSLDRLVESNPGGRPPIAGQSVAPNPVAAGADATVTTTVDRGTIESITASGCGASPETSTSPNVDEVVLTIPAGQPPGNCDITVVTRFADEPDKFGGEDRSETDLVPMTVEAA